MKNIKGLYHKQYIHFHGFVRHIIMCLGLLPYLKFKINVILYNVLHIISNMNQKPYNINDVDHYTLSVDPLFKRILSLVVK